MGGLGVRVLHISDLHMRTIDGPQAGRARLEAASRWRVLGEQWVANLAELRKDGVPFDLVVFTGDLGDQGHATDYPRAMAFLKQTCAALNVPLDRLFVVPGNHDIDRKVQAAAWKWVRDKIGSDPHAYSAWMAGSGQRGIRQNSRRDQILERQQAFWDAVATDLGRPQLEPRHSPHMRLGYRQAVTLPRLAQPIHVIGLDTAWLAGDDHDSGELRLTEHQVALLTTTSGGEPLPGFRLALMHHRLADLADADDARRLMADRVDLLLHGHQHTPTADVLQGPDHQLLVLATGCLYEGDEGHHYPNACQVIDLTLDEHARPRSAQIQFRGWSARSLFWGDDALLYQRAREGRLRLDRGERGWRFGENGDMRYESAPGSEIPAARMELVDVTRVQSGLDRSDGAPSGDGTGDDRCDHVHLHDRLKKVTDPIFEELLLTARIDRTHVSPRTASLATRVLEVAERAAVNPELCRRLTRLLDDRAPWTRAVPTDAARPAQAPVGVASAEVDKHLARVKREVAAAVKARPRPFAQLAARIGCGPEALPDRLVNLRGSVVAELVLAESDAQPSTPEGDADHDALKSVLFTVLPYVSDWRAEVASCCARDEGPADVVELRYRSDTIAEAVMAGWVGRQCNFEHKSGTEPFGVGAVQIPATSQTALFTSEQHLLDGVVKQLMYQLGVGGLNPQEQQMRVQAELRSRGRRGGPQRMRYYFLFRDAASPEEPGTLWRLARTTLHGEARLPSLVLVRMQGRLDDDEANLETCVAAMLKPPNPTAIVSVPA